MIRIMWVVTAICLVGNVLNVKKKAACFYVWILSNVFWLVYDLDTGLYSRAVLDIVQTAFSVWGAIEWGKERRQKVKTEEDILAEAIDSYGCEAQLKMLLEEMSELQKEICKMWRGKDNVEAIADECADLEIMLAQTKMIFGIEQMVKEHRRQKVARLEERLKQYQEERKNES